MPRVDRIGERATGGT